MIVQQPDLQGPLVKERGREALDALSDNGAGDGPGVDLIRLAWLALAAPCLTHHPRRDTNDALTRSDQRLLEAPGQVPAVLDRPHSLLARLARPAQRSRVA